MHRAADKLRPPTMSDKAPRTSRYLVPILRAALLPVAIVLLFALARRLGLGPELDSARRWLQAQGPWGGLGFVALYTLTAMAMLPGLPLTLAAGALFGVVWGMVWVSLGATLGAAGAFLLARGLAGEALRRWLGGRAAFQTLERWTREQGALCVVVNRLLPILPYSLINYAFGLTRVGFWTFLLWTWLAMLPGHLVWVTGSDALLGARRGEGGWTAWLLPAGALLLIAALLLLAWRRRRDPRV
jgi:uncharacterized membrane protein YdjX (TVP38/TMEM64 family)